MKKNFTIILILMIGLICVIPAFSAEKPVHVTADRLIYDTGKKEVTLTGNVRMNYQDAVISGDKATFNTETKVGNVLGNVGISQPGTTITGNRMVVNYGRHSASVNGNAKIVSVKNVERGELGGVTTLTSDRIDYNWSQQDGDASGRVVVIQKDRRAYSDKAHYSGSSEIITLMDNVRIEQGSNNWITSNRAIVDIRKETYMVTGSVKGDFLIDIKEGKSKNETDQLKIEDKIPIEPPPFEEKKAPG